MHLQSPQQLHCPIATFLLGLLALTLTLPNAMSHTDDSATASSSQLATATFGGGCFWCTEAVMEATHGVRSAVCGYSGGGSLLTYETVPTYETVVSGTTGHAEVVQVAYDPAEITYADLLEVFFRTHDPTTLNRQGADHGTQYRSVIFFHDKEQQQIAEEVKEALGTSGAYSGPIVTEIGPLTKFYAAEPYHQNYFARNPEQGYCRAVIAPKMAKFRKVFSDRLKANE